MALGTKTPQDKDYYNRTQDLYNREVAGSRTAKQDQDDAFEEEFGGDNFKKTADTSGSDILAQKAREQEQNPDNGFYNSNSNYGGKKSEGHKLTWKNIRAITKKRGPLGLILVILTGGGIGISTLLSPSVILIHIEKNLVSKYDSQNTSLTIRTNRLIAAKITNSTTSGLCNTKQIACRFSRPSNKLLKNLAKNNVVAYKGNQVVTSNGPFPNARPDRYEFTDNRGNKLSVAAKDFSKVLNSNDDFRAAFHRSYNPLYVGLKDAISKAVRVRFGVKENNSLADAKDEKTALKEIDDTVKGEDIGAKTAASEGGTAADDAVKKLINEEADKSVTKIAESGKGDAVGLAAGAACLLGDVPGMIISTERAYQMVQVVRYGMVFLTAASATEAGKGTPQEASTLGLLLTTVVAGKSAMDSFGMRYSLFGDTSPAKNDSYQTFSPGQSAIVALGAAAQIRNNQAVKVGCDIATNPVTGATINVALAANTVDTLGASLFAAGLNIAAGWAASTVIEAVLPPILSATIGLLPINSVLKLFFGDLTQGIEGEAVGNALASGASHMLGQTANARGNMPLSIKQALAYNDASQQVELAYAKEDRATLSPFDVSSPNTMLGSIVEGLLPYYSKMSSLTGVMSTIANITGNSLRSIIEPSIAGAAAVNTAQYTLCEDESIRGKNIAAGPFCNIIYGIPPEFLNIDPQTVVNDLVADGEIDPDSGDPIDTGDSSTASLKGWMDLCTDGTTDQASNCMITDTTDKKIVEYALYTIDHSIQKTMDGEDTNV